MLSRIKRYLTFLVVEIFIFLFLLGVVIGCMELYYWYTQGRLVKNFPPNDIINYTWGHKVRTNPYWFRDKNYELVPLKNGFRIIVLGDSFTWGAGVSEDERYSNLLEKYLKEKHPQKKIEVLTFARSGGPTTQECEDIRRYYKQLQPDLVIVGFCTNDPKPGSSNDTPERVYYREKIKPLQQKLQKYKLKGTTEYITKIYEGLLIAFRKMPSWIGGVDRSYNKDSNDWKEFVRALKDIRRMSAEVTPYPPIFISLNEGASNSGPTDYNKPNKALRVFLRWYHQAEEAAISAGFIAVNCEEEFKKELKNYLMMLMPASYTQDASNICPKINCCG
ncbi:MAG: SGNH/GDSL hydrolase family protein [Elusimicrobiota bacterium]